MFSPANQSQTSCSDKGQKRRHRRGNTMIYTMLAMPVFLGFASLAVDFGILQLTKAELQTSADAAARYAADGFSSGGAAAVRSRATQSVNENKITARNGQVVQPTTNVEFGVWDAVNSTFNVCPAGAEDGATAIRVNVSLSQANNNAVSLPFASIVGLGKVGVARSTTVARGTTVSPVVSGTCCPWMAGMPVGTTINGTGGNPQSMSGSQYAPYQISLSTFSAGQGLRFRQSSGTTSMWGYTDLPMDGQTSWIVTQTAVNGINQTSAPIGAMMGIFLDDNAPNTTPVNTAMDFSSEASRDFTTLRPGLKQVFFIGDGLDSDGKLQEFVPPAGATRLYLGIMDEKGWWWDNTGSIKSTILDHKITTVK